MKKCIDTIYENILKSTDNIDAIIKELRNIKENIISIGSGGSWVVANYVASVLTKKNNIEAISIDPSDIKYIDSNKYISIFVSSFSGSNYGVKYALNSSKKKYLLSARKTKITDEILLHYDLKSESSFISLNTTMVPMAIMLKYYLGEKRFVEVINDIYEKIEKDLTIELKEKHLNIFSNRHLSASTSFIESTLVESGITIPLIHSKYSYCHGRSTINKNNCSPTLILGYNNSDLDQLISSTMQDNNSPIVIIKSIYEDDIINDFYLTWQSIYLMQNVAASQGIDLANIDYDKNAVKKLYYFKGSM